MIGGLKRFQRLYYKLLGIFFRHFTETQDERPNLDGISFLNNTAGEDR